MSIQYITTGERIDGSNAPDNRPDVLNRPLKELIEDLSTGDFTVSAKNILFDISEYTLDTNITTDDLVYLDGITIKKTTPINTSLGFINLTNNKLTLNGYYIFSNRNDLIPGERYFISKTIPGFIVPATSLDASEVYIGTGINSNEIFLNIGQTLLPESSTQIIIDNINSINTNVDNINSINTNADNIYKINIIGNDLTNQISYIDDYGSILDPVELGTGTSKIAIVADNIDSVNIIADNISFGWSGTIVAGNTITVVNGIITDVQ